MITVWHNNRCRKSREALAWLDERGEEYEIREYLKEVPTKEELIHVLAQLGLKPFDILRKGEKVFKESFKGKDLSDDEWIQAMIDNPKLIERPIVIKDGMAEIARPIENLDKLF